MSQTELHPRLYTKAFAVQEYAKQAEKLSLRKHSHDNGDHSGQAVEATFITPLDPVIETADGNRLPVVPVEEAYKINALKDQLDGKKTRRKRMRPRGLSRFDAGSTEKDALEKSRKSEESNIPTDKLGEALPPSRTHPLFPPLPLYGPPSAIRNLQCIAFRMTSAVLSTCFLLVIVLGALFTSVPKILSYFWLWLTFRNPNARRPFYDEECRRAALRKQQEKEWHQRQQDAKVSKKKMDRGKSSCDSTAITHSFPPLEGGPDRLVCSGRYYARRVGLDIEEFKVQTEDGFIVTLWHVYDPNEYVPMPELARQASSPEVFVSSVNESNKHKVVKGRYRGGQRRYPVLLMHGLLQSAGAYCCNDDDSLAFYLCKSGYDVWLGNNRCGFHPEHSLLDYKDPRMWAWNIRQMGVMDLPALISRVLDETGFERLGLVCHSQGTTETFVALAKEQRPDLGEKISVFCALAPAVYAGPLIGKMYFKFMRVISPAMFRIFFGIHAFIPLMMTMHHWLPGKLYGFMGYHVFNFLFDWSDTRWDRAIRDRVFQFSPVYVSAESMRWWLGRECFAKHRCILSTREVDQFEDAEDDDSGESKDAEKQEVEDSKKKDRGRTAWYSDQMPPLALWIAGSDKLVDGERLLRRFERGREPHVDVIHAKVIPEYEHLDVIWAVDAIEQVGQEVRDVLWQTMNDTEREVCRSIEGVCDTDSETEDEKYVSPNEKLEFDSNAGSQP